jgi:hypothetical protein
MPEDPHKKNPPEPRRISVQDDFVARYWTKKFHADEQNQNTMIKNAGPTAPETKHELDK